MSLKKRGGANIEYMVEGEDSLNLETCHSWVEMLRNKEIWKIIRQETCFWLGNHAPMIALGESGQTLENAYNEAEYNITLEWRKVKDERFRQCFWKSKLSLS